MATKEGTRAIKAVAQRKAEAGGEPFGGGKNWKELARTGLELRTWKKEAGNKNWRGASSTPCPGGAADRFAHSAGPG